MQQIAERAVAVQWVKILVEALVTIAQMKRKRAREEGTKNNHHLAPVMDWPINIEKPSRCGQKHPRGWKLLKY